MKKNFYLLFYIINSHNNSMEKLILITTIFNTLNKFYKNNNKLPEINYIITEEAYEEYKKNIIKKTQAQKKEIENIKNSQKYDEGWEILKQEYINNTLEPEEEKICKIINEYIFYKIKKQLSNEEIEIFICNYNICEKNEDIYKTDYNINIDDEYLYFNLLITNKKDKLFTEKIQKNLLTFAIIEN